MWLCLYRLCAHVTQMSQLRMLLLSRVLPRISVTTGLPPSCGSRRRRCRAGTRGSRLDHQFGDGTIAKGEPEVEVGLPAREVALQVVGDVVVVVVQFGGARHLDRVREFAG